MLRSGERERDARPRKNGGQFKMPAQTLRMRTGQVTLELIGRLR